MTLASTMVDGANHEGNKKEKRGVALFGPPGFDIFGVLPSFGMPWNPMGFGGAVWPGSVTSDFALGQIQAQATHDVAIQVLLYCLQNIPRIQVLNYYYYYFLLFSGPARSSSWYTECSLSARSNSSCAASQRSQSQCSSGSTESNRS